MKRRNKILSLMLAFALVVTAVPNEWIVRTPEVKAADGENGPQEITVVSPAGTQLMYWEPEEGENAAVVSTDGAVRTETVEYETVSHSESLSMPSMYDYKTQDAVVLEAFGQESGSVSLYPSDIEYQWYEKMDGEKVKLEAETEDYFYGRATNAEKEKTYVCVATLKSVRIDGIQYMVEDIENSSDYILSIEQEFKMLYTGPVVDKADLGTYFSGVEAIQDQTLTIGGNGIEDSRYMSVSELNSINSNAYFNYAWEVYFKDGTSRKLEDWKEEHDRYSSAREGHLYENDANGLRKQVDYYECSVDLCYGYQVIDTVSKKFYFSYRPFRINAFFGNESVDSSKNEAEKEVRENGTAQMKVNVTIENTSAVKSGSQTYQWYEINAAGNAKKLNGETANSYTVRIPDASVSYRVDVTVQSPDGYNGPVFDQTQSFTYAFTFGDGYLLKDRSNTWQQMNIGDTKTLYVLPQVDDSYTLEYQWEQLSYAKDENGDYVYEQDENGNSTGRYKIVSEELGTENECEIKPTKESDFELISGTYNESFYRDCNYIVTVTVKRDDETVDTHVYSFGIMEDDYFSVSDKSDYSQVLDPGDDLELFVRTEEKGGFTQEKTWYEKLVTAPAIVQTDNETGKTSYLPYKESAVPQEQEYDRVTEGSYVTSEWDAEQSKYIYVYNCVFWKKVGTGDTFTKQGKNGAGIVDVRGEYRWYMDVYRDSEMTKPETERNLFTRDYEDFVVSYDSDLSAYAKSTSVYADEGDAAKLRVVAQTKSDVYKINYKWEKQVVDTNGYPVLNADGNYTWEVLEDAAGAAYEIAAAALDDAGRYRVTVSDEYGQECTVPVWLSVHASDVPTTDDVTDVCFTPSKTVYRAGMDAELTLKLDMQLSDKDTDVFYAWYRDEKLKTAGEFSGSQENWELIGEDENTYDLFVEDEDDYTTYKCLAVYRRNSTEYAAREVYFDVRPAYSAELERMTPGEQIKKLGDQASYSVRLVTDDPEQAGNAVYQWYSYRDGRYTEISGATQATYEIAALGKDDFGRLYCEARDKTTGERIAETVSFYTRIYLNGAYLESSYDEVEAKEGDNITVGPPVIVKGDGLDLTYQWYRLGEVYASDDRDSYARTIIYGATDATYSIDEIGDNEFGEYECEVYADGSSLATYHTTVIHKQEEIEEEKAPIEVSVREGYEKNVKAFLGSSTEVAITAVSNKDLALRYQWYFDDEAIGDATGAAYRIDVMTSAKVGSYYCVVMDAEGNTAVSDTFNLSTTTGLDVKTEGLDPEAAIGVQTTFGAQGVVLTATASAEHGYTPFFQWYHETIDDKGLIYGGTDQTLALPAIDEDALGMYYCVVQDSSGQDYTLKYYVYVNNGLNVMPSTYYVVAQVDGSAKMYVTATANAGCAISYQWSKWDEEEDEYVDITGATAATLSIASLKSTDYGDYRCVISTVGERNVYRFHIGPGYSISADREFAHQGDRITVSVELENPAADYTYSYQWYEQEPVIGGTYRQVRGATTAVCTTTVPVIDLSEQYTNNEKSGYVPVSYKCIVTISDGEREWKKEVDPDVSVNVLPAVRYQTTTYPETTHPNDKSFDIQGYQASGATALAVTFDAQTDLGNARLCLINSAGKAEYYTDDELAAKTVNIQGDSVVFLMNGNEKAASYGYKVSAIKATMPPKPAVSGGSVSKPGTGSTVKSTTVRKGKKYTVKKLIYKVTSTTAKKKTVTVVGAKSKKVTSVSIPATVTLGGAKYKVTAISAKAFQSYSKLKKVTIGKNVKTIGASAFAKDKKLTKITIKGTVLKSVGKKAFAKVPKKARATVPKKSRKAYKKMLKKGAYKGKVK